MATLVFRNTPYNIDGIVRIPDDMPAKQRADWLAALKGYEPDPLPFEPHFLLAFGFDSITGMRWQLNTYMFADEDTTKYIAAKFGNGNTRESDALGPGPFGVDQKMWEFQIEDGKWVNAGMIASYYVRNPLDQFPGVADKLIRGVLANG